MHLTYPVRVPTVSDGEHTHPSLGIVYMCPTYKRHSFWPFHSGSLRIIGLVIYIKARIGSLKTIHHIVLFWQTSLFSVLSGWVCNTNLKLCEEKVRVRKVRVQLLRKFEMNLLGVELASDCTKGTAAPFNSLKKTSVTSCQLQTWDVKWKIFPPHWNWREGHSLILLNP